MVPKIIYKNYVYSLVPGRSVRSHKSIWHCTRSYDGIKCKATVHTDGQDQVYCASGEHLHKQTAPGQADGIRNEANKNQQGEEPRNQPLFHPPNIPTMLSTQSIQQGASAARREAMTNHFGAMPSGSRGVLYSAHFFETRPSVICATMPAASQGIHPDAIIPNGEPRYCGEQPITGRVPDSDGPDTSGIGGSSNQRDATTMAHIIKNHGATLLDNRVQMISPQHIHMSNQSNGACSHSPKPAANVRISAHTPQASEEQSGSTMDRESQAERNTLTPASSADPLSVELIAVKVASQSAGDAKLDSPEDVIILDGTEEYSGNEFETSTSMCRKLQTELDKRERELKQCSARLEKAEGEINRLTNENSKLTQDLAQSQNPKDELKHAKEAIVRLSGMNKELETEAKRLWNKIYRQGSSETKNGDGNWSPAVPKKSKSE